MSMICLECGTVGRTKTRTKGSILIELLLWCCFLVPGLIYSVWRMTTRQRVCKCCGSTRVVPITSPAGQRCLNHGRGW